MLKATSTHIFNSAAQKIYAISSRFKVNIENQHRNVKYGHNVDLSGYKNYFTIKTFVQNFCDLANKTPGSLSYLQRQISKSDGMVNVNVRMAFFQNIPQIKHRLSVATKKYFFFF